MADEITTPVVEASAPAPAIEVAPDATATATAEPDMAAIIAELEAMPAGTGEPATPAAGEGGEAPAETAEAKTDDSQAETPKTEEPAAEPESVATARKLLAAANKKQRLALEAVPQAEAKLFELFKSDPRAFLAKAGISIQDWIGLVSNSGAAAEEKPVTAEDRVKLLEEREAQRQLDAEQANIDRLKTEIHETIKAKHAAEFPKLVKSGQLSLVTDVQVDYYNTHKKQLPYLVAAKQVENYLRSLDGEAPISTPAKAPAPAPKANSTRPASQTLTNTSTGSAPTQGELPLDPEARYRAVLAEFGA